MKIFGEFENNVVYMAIGKTLAKTHTKVKNSKTSRKVTSPKLWALGEYEDPEPHWIY